MFDINTIAATCILPMIHPAYVDTVTAALRDALEEMSFGGDPYKFADTMYRIVVGDRDGKKIPLFLPIGEDALEIKLQHRVRKTDSPVVDTAPWSADLKKDTDKAKLRWRGAWMSDTNLSHDRM